MKTSVVCVKMRKWDKCEDIDLFEMRIARYVFYSYSKITCEFLNISKFKRVKLINVEVTIAEIIL